MNEVYQHWLDVAQAQINLQQAIETYSEKKGV